MHTAVYLVISLAIVANGQEICSPSGIWFKFGFTPEVSFGTLGARNLLGNYKVDVIKEYKHEEFDGSLGETAQFCSLDKTVTGSLAYFDGHGPLTPTIVSFDTETAEMASMTNVSALLKDSPYHALNDMLACSVRIPNIVYIPAWSNNGGGRQLHVLAIDVAKKSFEKIFSFSVSPRISLSPGAALDGKRNLLYVGYWTGVLDKNYAGFLVTIDVLKKAAVRTVQLTDPAHAENPSTFLYFLTFDVVHDTVVITNKWAGSMASRTYFSHVDPVTGVITTLNELVGANFGFGFVDPTTGLFGTTYNSEGSTGQMRSLLTVDGISGKTLSNHQIGDGSHSNYAVVGMTCSATR